MSIFASKRELDQQSKTNPTHLAELPVSMIVPNPDQPRRRFDERAIRELAASIQQLGLIQPLVVHRREDCFELIAGERRLNAVKLLGWRHVRCIVQGELREGDTALMAIVENLQREDLNCFEEAECYAQLLRDLKLKQEELAERIGKSQSYVANKLRLLKLEPELRKQLVDSGLTERHARALLRIPKGENRAYALERMCSEALTVKESERMIDRLMEQSKEVRRPRIIRVFKDYRLFVNSIGSACDQLRESGLNVNMEQTDVDNGVRITITVSQNMR